MVLFIWDSWGKLLKSVGAKSHEINSQVPLQFGHSRRSILWCLEELETEYFSNKWVKYISVVEERQRNSGYQSLHSE